MDNKTIQLIQSAANKFNIDKVILFGSRAKNNSFSRSDYDLFVCGEDFYKFYDYMTEDVISLETFDITNGNTASQELINEVNRTGVVIYEKA